MEICYKNKTQMIGHYCHDIALKGEEALIGFQVSPLVKEQTG